MFINCELKNLLLQDNKWTALMKIEEDEEVVNKK